MVPPHRRLMLLLETPPWLKIVWMLQLPMALPQTPQRLQAIDSLPMERRITSSVCAWWARAFTTVRESKAEEKALSQIAIIRRALRLSLIEARAERMLDHLQENRLCKSMVLGKPHQLKLRKRRTTQVQLRRTALLTKSKRHSSVLRVYTLIQWSSLSTRMQQAISILCIITLEQVCTAQRSHLLQQTQQTSVKMPQTLPQLLSRLWWRSLRT